MALSGQFSFNLTAHEIIREASERCGGGKLNGEELRSYSKYLQLVMRNILNQGIPLSLLCQWQEPLISGQDEYDLGCIIDIHSATILNETNQTEFGVRRVSYGEFNQIPRKTQTGRPTTYLAERKYDRVTVRVWPVPNNDDYYMSMYVIVKPDDISKYTDEVRIQPRYLPAVLAGLAYEIGILRNIPIDKLAFIKGDYDEKLMKAQEEDRERVDFKIVPRLGR